MKHTLFTLPLVMIVLITAILSVPAQTKERSYMVISSDASIAKYRQNQMEFSGGMIGASVEIDLARTAMDVTALQKMLDRDQPEVIYTVGSRAFLLASKVEAKAPIIFTSVVNYRRLPLINTSFGIAGELPAAMQLTLFRHFFPKLTTIGIVYSGQYNEQWFRKAAQEARKMGVRLVGRKIASPQGLTRSLATLLPQVDALWLVADPLVFSCQSAVEDIFSAADKEQVAVLTYSKAFRPFKPTLIVAVDDPTVGRQAAVLASRLVGGERPAMQVQPPAGSSILLDMAKVEQYGLQLNSTALASVNELLE